MDAVNVADTHVFLFCNLHRAKLFKCWMLYLSPSWKSQRCEGKI